MTEVQSLDEIVGKTIVKAENDCDQEIHFYLDNGEHYRMYHRQNCCEDVFVEDICEDLEDVVGSPVVYAEVVTNDESDDKNYGDSYTWTFYKIGTEKGSVTIRWYGTSNGWYSEEVDFEKVVDS